MFKAPFRILVIASNLEKSNYVIDLLSGTSHELTVAQEIESILISIRNKTIDIVIHINNAFGDDGFNSFRKLRPYLLNAGIPFILFLEEFNKEDIVVGLEMGIDNFIFPPLDKESLIFKLENEIIKKTRLDIFNTDKFDTYFNTSLVPMFFVSNNKVVKANPSFYVYSNSVGTDILKQPIRRIFNIEGNSENELNYTKFRSGLIKSCKLSRVQCVTNANAEFDIMLYQGIHSQEFSHILGEMLPCNFNFLAESEIRQNVETKFKDRIKVTYGRLENNEISVKLTKREKEIFQLSADGLPIKMIAEKLNLSDRTVEKHRANIMLKTNSNNIIEAIVRINQNKRNKELYYM